MADFYVGDRVEKVVKFNDNGDEDFEIDVGAEVNALAVDSNENIYTGDSDGLVKKFDSTGTQQWNFNKHFYGGVNGVAVDDNGNVYSVGDDKFIRKLDSTGTEVWNRKLNFYILDVAVDANEIVYTGDKGGGVKKIDPSLTEQNEIIWNFDFIRSPIFGVAVDSTGNVYTADEQSDLRKINSSGTQMWQFTEHFSEILTVAVDGNQNVYTGSEEQVVRKINSQGDEVWSERATARVNAISVDQNDDVYFVEDDGNVERLNSDKSKVFNINFAEGVFSGLSLAVNPGSFTISQGL